MRRILSQLLMFAVLAGCGDQAAGTAPVPPPPLCYSDSDCSLSNYVCRETVCVFDSPNEVTVSLHVRPPADSGLRDEQFDDIKLSESRRLPDLILSAPATLRGFIKVRNNPLATSIPARVSLLKRGSIPGTRQRIEADAADGAGYEMSLLPGLYDISVFPENKRFPPFKEEDFRVKGDTVRDVVLPAPEEYLRVTGRVVGEPGDATGIADMRVQAFTPLRDRLSTPAVTDLEGRFELLLPPTSAVYSIHVSPTEADPLRPSVTQDGVLVEDDLELTDLALGAAELIPMQIEGVISGTGAATDVGGAQIEAKADVGNGVFQWTATTDETGQYSASVLPGQYTVRIVPPSDQSELAVTHTQLAVAPRSAEDGAATANLEIRRRVALAGVVQDASGNGRQGIVIEALLTGNGDVKGLVRKETATTGPGGAYSLTLDPGLHDLTVIPPDASGLPRWVWRAQEVRETKTIDYRVKDADVITGVLRSPDDKPLPDATVEVFLPQEDGGDAWVIGVGMTDATGRYTIVLPNP